MSIGFEFSNPADDPAGRLPVHGETPAQVHGETPVKIGSGGTDVAQVDKDQSLILRLSVEGFDGPAWTELVGHLYDYARRTLHGFILQGLVPIKIRQVLPGDDQAVQTTRAFVAATEDEFRSVRDDVVREALADTLSYWRRRVIPQGRWNPGGGAQLRTYFVNVALKRLVKVAARTMRDMQELTPPGAEDIIERELAAAAVEVSDSSSPYSRIDNADAARRRLAELDLTETESRIFALIADGYTHEQVAEELGLKSRKAVENRVARCRQRLAS